MNTKVFDDLIDDFIAEQDEIVYNCFFCGKPITAIEADDNDGKCEDCAANEYV